ncbi:hypothetical protein V7128_24240 [Neobacillus vireti]|uniref:hypothetical protein n=1 Tax=Neobacillus vireti TaxID=220686 RepID=UPI002FFFA9B9
MATKRKDKFASYITIKLLLKNGLYIYNSLTLKADPSSPKAAPILAEKGNVN